MFRLKRELVYIYIYTLYIEIKREFLSVRSKLLPVTCDDVYILRKNRSANDRLVIQTFCESEPCQANCPEFRSSRSTQACNLLSLVYLMKNDIFVVREKEIVRIHIYIYNAEYLLSRTIFFSGTRGKLKKPKLLGAIANETIYLAQPTIYSLQQQ